MNLEQFGEELAQARVSKGISLADISAETRINLKFLEAIEQGKFQILPQTYVRAFLREYALILNLDPSDVLDRYDSLRQEGQIRKAEETVAQQISPLTKTAEENFKDRLLKLTPLQRNLAFAIFLLVVIGLIIILANMNRELESNKPVEEIPFDRVIRESEASSLPPPTSVLDSAAVFMEPKKDSLRLQIITLDSVWISLLIDGTKGGEYLFAPKRKRTWVAKERFVITMGNAGGATFLLNGKDIGSLGKPGAVVRNSVITDANLKN